LSVGIPDVTGYERAEALQILNQAEVATVRESRTAPPAAGVGSGAERVVQQREVEGGVELVIAWERYEQRNG